MESDREWIHPIRDWSNSPEESANSLSHGVGFVLSVIGAAFLLVRVTRFGDARTVAACAVYSLSLMAVYAMSTLSHVCVNPHRKRYYEILDQAFIYLLIVGTYTPFSVACLQSTPWWIFLGCMWLLAVVGFVSKVIWTHRVQGVAIWIYVVLGWVPIVSAPSLANSLPAVALWWSLIGGLFYTVGTLFLMNDHRVRHFHAVWHVCVMAGSACHFFTVYAYVVPLARLRGA